MRTSLPCPCCQQTLTFIATPPVMACPFCRLEIPTANGKNCAGTKVRCERCWGTFTAEAPPPIRVYASWLEACPFCELVLAIRRDLPEGKKVRCSRCRRVFRPKQRPPQGMPVTHEAGHIEAEAAPMAAVLPPAPINKPVSKTHLASKPYSKLELASSNGSGRSSRTHLAPGYPDAPETPQESASGGDDDIDIFDRERNQAAPVKPMGAPVHGRASPAAPEASEMPATQRVPHPGSAGAPGKSVPKAPAPQPQRPAKPAAAPAPAAENPDANKEHPRARHKKHRAPAPAAEESPESAVPPADATTTEWAAAETNPAHVPLSSRSLELQAAEAFMDEEEPTEPQAGDVVVEEEESVAVSQRMPVLEQPKPTPVLPLRRPAPAEPAGLSLNLDFKKGMNYVVCAAALIALGIGGYFIVKMIKNRRPAAFAVSGVVYFQGKPAEGARITLYPVNGKRDRYYPSAKVGADGSFTLTTFRPNDGAPAGRYFVEIRKSMEMEDYAELSKKHSDDEVARISEELAHDPLTLKYGNPRESGLTAEIIAGVNPPLEYKLE